PTAAAVIGRPDDAAQVRVLPAAAIHADGKTRALIGRRGLAATGRRRNRDLVRGPQIQQRSGAVVREAIVIQADVGNRAGIGLFHRHAVARIVHDRVRRHRKSAERAAPPPNRDSIVVLAGDGVRVDLHASQRTPWLGLEGDAVAGVRDLVVLYR